MSDIEQVSVAPGCFDPTVFDQGVFDCGESVAGGQGGTIEPVLSTAGVIAPVVTTAGAMERIYP